MQHLRSPRYAAFLGHHPEIIQMVVVYSTHVMFDITEWMSQQQANFIRIYFNVQSDANGPDPCIDDS
jgi:hypothetical protein